MLDISVPALNTNTIRTQLVRILHLRYNTACFPLKTRVRGRRWRLTGRLTEMFLGGKAAHKTTQHLQAWTCMDRQEGQRNWPKTLKTLRLLAVFPII